MKTHTAGPWSLAHNYFNNEHHDDKICSVLGGDWIIAEVCGDMPDARANAALIAAAPELLEALEDALNLLASIRKDYAGICLPALDRILDGDETGGSEAHRIIAKAKAQK